MDSQMVLDELEKLSSPRLYKQYVNNGAKEPLFGVATTKMKPLFKQVKINHPLALTLYDTGNYDAMYFAGMIADPTVMKKSEFEHWINQAYFYMISDYIVAVTLAESPLGQTIANEWISAAEPLKRSAGWHCYTWMLGNQKDENFSTDHLINLLDLVVEQINQEHDRVKIAMKTFLETVGVSYVDLHEEAFTLAKKIGDIQLENRKVINAYKEIEKAIEKKRIGFKRKHVRC